jgi:hypothetical protein
MTSNTRLMLRCRMPLWLRSRLARSTPLHRSAYSSTRIFNSFKLRNPALPLELLSHLPWAKLLRTESSRHIRTRLWCRIKVQIDRSSTAPHTKTWPQRSSCKVAATSFANRHDIGPLSALRSNLKSMK